jgi:hypothetical protein
VLDLSDRAPVDVARMIPREVDDMGIRLDRSVSRQAEVRNQRGPSHLAVLVHIRNVVDQKESAADLHLVPFQDKALQVGITTYQCAGH